MPGSVAAPPPGCLTAVEDRCNLTAHERLAMGSSEHQGSPRLICVTRAGFCLGHAGRHLRAAIVSRDGGAKKLIAWLMLRFEMRISL